MTLKERIGEKSVNKIHVAIEEIFKVPLITRKVIKWKRRSKFSTTNCTAILNKEESFHRKISNNI